MGRALPAMAEFALKLLRGDALKTATEEGYIERGVCINTFFDEVGPNGP